MQPEQIALQRLQNQFLLEPAGARNVVSGLIGLQAQYGANALQALAIRSCGGYKAGDYVKTWSLRGTLHLHAVYDLPLVLYYGCQTRFGQEAYTDSSVEPRRRELFRRLLLKALASGDQPRESLRERCLAAGMSKREEEVFFHPWGGLFRAMAENGEIAYAAEGTRQFTKLAPFTPMERESALHEMTRRYLAHYGPVTLRDAQTFFGIPQRELKPYFEREAGEAASAGKDVYYLSPAQAEPAADMPGVAFLAGFDPLLMGYRKTENPFLPRELVKRVYNNTGIVFPTVLLHGKVAALWRRAGGRAEVTPLGRIGPRERRRIERSAVDMFAFSGVKWIED